MSNPSVIMPDDHVDHSRWADFCDRHAKDFNPSVLTAMIEDIEEIRAGMATLDTGKRFYDDLNNEPF